MGEYTIIIVIIVLFFIIGLLLANGKCLFLLANYNKKEFDEKALSRFVGLIFIAISLCTILVPVGLHFEMYWILYFSMALTTALIVFAAIYPKKENRFSVKNDL